VTGKKEIKGAAAAKHIAAVTMEKFVCRMSYSPVEVCIRTHTRAHAHEHKRMHAYACVFACMQVHAHLCQPAFHLSLMHIRVYAGHNTQAHERREPHRLEQQRRFCSLHCIHKSFSKLGSLPACLSSRRPISVGQSWVWWCRGYEPTAGRAR
jgi:hypothetical protein